MPGFWEGSRSNKDSKHQRLHDSHPWLQADAHAGQEHVEQPQSLHLAAQPQEPGAQPQLEEQEQAMLGLVEESSRSREEESERDALKKIFFTKVDDNKHQRIKVQRIDFRVSLSGDETAFSFRAIHKRIFLHLFFSSITPPPPPPPQSPSCTAGNFCSPRATARGTPRGTRGRTEADPNRGLRIRNPNDTPRK